MAKLKSTQIYGNLDVTGEIHGNASSATKLKTPRQINGTNFDGTANITTEQWGKARNIQIGKTSKSVNGSANVSWTLEDIGASDSAHSHGLLHSNLTVRVENTATDNGWSMINSSYNGFILKSIRANQNAPAWLLNNHAAGIAFGGGDTKGVMSVSYNGPYVRFAGGNGTKPVWNFTLKGSNAREYDLDRLYNATPDNTANMIVKRDANGNFSAGTITASLSGNASTATKLQTGRIITIGNTNRTFDGTANITWTVADIGAAPTNHTHTSNQITDATNANTANMIVKRDANGNFSAGTITASLSGNASTATKLATARQINGTNFDGTGNITTANWGTARNLKIGNYSVSVNGSGNYTWNLEQINGVCGGTPTKANTNKYQKIGRIDVSSGNWVACNGVLYIMDTESQRFSGALSIYVRSTDVVDNQQIRLKWLSIDNPDYIDKVYLVKSSNRVYDIYVKTFETHTTIRFYFIPFTGVGCVTLTGSQALVDSITPLYTSSYADTIATRLATPRQINGTNFDGTANITTEQWGKARNIQIGKTSKSVNGSANVSWSLEDIGASDSAHSHGLLHSNLTVGVENTTTDNGWSMINSSYNGFILKSIRANQNAPAWLLNNYAAGIAFGGGDTKGVMSVSYNGAYVRFAGGNGTKPVWNFTLKGTNVRQYDLDMLYNATADNTANMIVKRDGNGNFKAGTITASLSGNASTATKLQTGRVITIGNTNRTFDGSANITWTVADIGAAPTNHTHTSNQITDATNANTANMIVKRDANGNFSAGTITASLSGNASTATKLATARQINGTNFDGTGNITTANWGTARNLKIGNYSTSVNGSGNYTWTLEQINGVCGGTATKTNLDKYQKIARIDVSSGNWVACNGILYIMDTESQRFSGALSIYVRSTDVVDNQQIRLKWLSIDNPDYIDKVYLVKSSNRVFDLYIQTFQSYTSIRFYFIPTSGFNLITLTGGQPLVDSITPHVTSSFAKTIATQLDTPRQINGTNFDGTANITTAHWGTARDIKIGNTTRSVNGSGNYTWSHADLGTYRTFIGHQMGDSQTNITTEQFLTLLENKGAFSQASILRGSWVYNESNIITDTGCGNIHLAGALIEVVGRNKGECTIRIHTATTSSNGGMTNGDFIYVNNGSGYSPGWRRLYNTKNKPTAADVGALPITGGTLTGKLRINSNSKELEIGCGGTDVYICNTASNMFLQLKDDGLLRYNNNIIYHEGWKPTPVEIGALPLSGGTVTGHITIQNNSINPAGNYNGTTAYNATPLGLSIVQTGDAVNGFPTTYSTMLTVNGSENRQFQISVVNSGAKIAFRAAHVNNTGGTGTGWTAWKDIYHTGFKPTPADIGASPSNHTHNYLPLTGGELTGGLTFSNSGTSFRGISGIMANNDGWRVGGGATAADAGYLEIATSDNGNEPIYVRQYSGGSGNFASATLTRSLTLLDASGNTILPGFIKLADGVQLSNVSGDKRLQINTNYGLAKIGPANVDWCHFDTDRGKFHFSKPVYVQGEIYAGSGYNQKVYHTGNKPTPADIGAAPSSHTHDRISGPNSNLVQVNQPNDYAGLAKKNNVNIDTWHGFSISNKCSGQSVAVDGVAFSVNARNGEIFTPYRLTSSMSSSTHLNGNQGKAIINSTAGAGSYTMLAKMNSTNGYFTMGTYQGTFMLYYTAKSTVDAGTNATTKNVTLLNESGNASFPGTVTAPTFSGALSGNASTATKLQTARSINGTNFDGTGNITTANWGTARTITIGSTGKSVNGSGNVSWTLSEIGAAASSHTHSSLKGASGGNPISSSVSTGYLQYNYGIDGNTAGLFPWVSNANGLLTINKHEGNYYSQLGFSSNGKLYYRNFEGAALNTTTGWSEIAFTSSVVNAANKLATARSINGTNFDGTGNITTANWGTARSITIGNTGKSVNGSANVTWSISEIGAVPLSTRGNITIHADSDASTTNEYIMLKAGHNELKVTTSGGGSTVTKGQDKLTFNGNVVYHAGKKPTPADIGAAPSSHTHSSSQISDATASNNANTIVKRDGSGNFNAGRITLSNWIYCSGNTGIFFNTHDGGWFMQDTTWVRSYKNKSIYTGGDIKADGKLIGGSAQIRGGMTASGWVSGSGFTSGGGWYEVNAGEPMKLRSGSGNIIVMPKEGLSMVQLYPNGNNTGNLGTADMRWSRIYTVNGMNQSSDSRYKTNIETVNTSDCFEMIKNIDVYTYILLGEDKRKLSRQQLIEKTEENKNNIEIGVIAQDIAKFKYGKYIVEKGDSSENEDSFYAISPYNLTSATIAALKEEINLRESLESKVETLESEIQELKSLVTQLLNR